jgi:hypothetical protein
MILRPLCIWLVFYSLLSSLILSNLKHELLNRLRSTIYGSECVNKQNNISKFLPFLRYAKDLIGQSDIINLKTAAVLILTRQFTESFFTKQYEKQRKCYTKEWASSYCNKSTICKWPAADVLQIDVRQIHHIAVSGCAIDWYPGDVLAWYRHSFDLL